MAEHMRDVLDAYSVHIYWNYWDIPRMEFRLRDVRRIVSALEGDARDLEIRLWVSDESQLSVRGFELLGGQYTT